MAEMAHEAHCFALRQLETGLRLYFEREDYYSVITLAGAAEAIFGQLVKRVHSEGPNALESLKQDHAAVHKKLWGEPLADKKIVLLANRVRNRLKHLDSGQSCTIPFDAREEAVDMLNRAIDNYYSLTGCLTLSMERFQAETVTDHAQIRTEG